MRAGLTNETDDERNVKNALQLSYVKLISTHFHLVFRRLRGTL